MEFAGVDKAARLKMGVWKMQEWTLLSARCGKGGHCWSGQRGTMWQGWTMQEWTYRHGMSRVGNAEKNVSK